MLDVRYDRSLRHAASAQLVGNQDARRLALPLQQLVQEPVGGAHITPSLDKQAPTLVDGPPEPALHTGNLRRNLVEVLLVSSARQGAPDAFRECLAEHQRPLAHSFVADLDVASGLQLLDHARLSWRRT